MAKYCSSSKTITCFMTLPRVYFALIFCLLFYQEKSRPPEAKKLRSLRKLIKFHADKIENHFIVVSERRIRIRILEDIRAALLYAAKVLKADEVYVI
jgi:hypothetical protein